MFKLLITLDHHNPRQKLNYCLLPDPPLFSLPPTFKWAKTVYYSPKVAHPYRLYGVKIMKIQAIENFTFGHLKIQYIHCTVYRVCLGPKGVQCKVTLGSYLHKTQVLSRCCYVITVRSCHKTEHHITLYNLTEQMAERCCFSLFASCKR